METWINQPLARSATAPSIPAGHSDTWSLQKQNHLGLQDQVVAVVSISDVPKLSAQDSELESATQRSKPMNDFLKAKMQMNFYCVRSIAAHDRDNHSEKTGPLAMKTLTALICLSNLCGIFLINVSRAAPDLVIQDIWITPDPVVAAQQRP